MAPCSLRNGSRLKVNNSSGMAPCSLFWMMFLVSILVSGATEGHARDEDFDNECSRERRCTKDHGGPAIRFPFRLRDHHPPRCGHPDLAFELSCDENHHTVLNLPRSAKLFVKKIHFINQEIEIYNPYDKGCFQRLILNNPDLNMSTSLFKFESCNNHLEKYVLFNCSIQNDEQQIYDHSPYAYNYIRCLSTPGYAVIAASNYGLISELTGCSIIGVTPTIPSDWIQPPLSKRIQPCLYLQWVAPYCITCEQQGRGCRFKENINNITASPPQQKQSVFT